MRQVSTGVVVGLALALAGGVAVARPTQAPPSTVATRAIDWAVETGEPVETHPEVAPLITVSGDDVPQGTVDGLSIAELQDLTAVAEQYDQSGHEVVAEATREREYIALYQEASRSDTFAGGVLGRDGDQTWVGFTGEAPTDFETRAQAAGVTVKEHQPDSRADLDALQPRVHDAASTKGDVTTMVDESTLRITVLTNAPAKDVEAAIARELGTTADRLGDEYPIDVVHQDGSLGENE